MSMTREVLSFLFLSTMSDLLAAMVLSELMGMSHRILTLSFWVTVLLIPSFCHLNAKLFAHLLVHVCGCLVVGVDIFSFSQFRATRDQVVNGLVQAATLSTFWVHIRLLEDAVLVPTCWEALILGCDDKTPWEALIRKGIVVHVSLFHSLWVFDGGVLSIPTWL